MLDIVPTQGQHELIVKFRAFLDGPERFFRLTGKPGVGKSTMTALLLKDLIAHDLKNSGNIYAMQVAGICLAHTAKNVLGDFIPNVFTFAKAFGMKEVINEITGARTFEYNKYNDGALIGKMSIPIFVHDEVSQYTKAMWKIVMENTPMFSKVLLIGDVCQLPPIDSNKDMPIDADSPVFDIPLPESCQHELTERVRQAANNPILSLSDIIREEILGSHNTRRVIEAISIPEMVNGVGYDFISYRDFFPHIEGKDILNTKFIAYRNKSIRKWNPKIRDYLLNDPINRLIPNDIITMNDNFYKYENNSERPSYVLHNGETLRLDDVDISLISHKVGGKTYRIPVYIARIEDQPHKQFIIPTESGQPILDDALEEIAGKCRDRVLMWHDSFWPFYKMFCKWSYGYCQSVYKSQGSTYESVYVDVNDILMCKPLTPKRQLQAIYTAITRAKKDVWFLKSNEVI